MESEVVFKCEGNNNRARATCCAPVDSTTSSLEPREKESRVRECEACVGLVLCLHDLTPAMT